MSLAAEIRRRLGPVPEGREWPLVSIVVLNRDGVALLRRLLDGLAHRTDYPHIELIFVDNGSSDESLDFVRTVDVPFPISIVANPHNESFSDACNQGAELASGELLLFLNNDTEPFEPGWLRELVACMRGTEAAAAASTLVCPDDEHEASFPHGYGVQHRGLSFIEEGGMIHPVLGGWEADPLDGELGEDRECDAVAAACLLVDRAAFEQVGGFSHGYVYGAEDVDLSLKLWATGLSVSCSGRSIVIHHPVSTRRRGSHEEERTRKLANRRLLWERWGPRLRREYELGRLRRGAPERRAAKALGFCLHDPTPGAVSTPLDDLVAALCLVGRRAVLLQGEGAEGITGLNYDVAVYVRGAMRCIPKSCQLNVLWTAAPGITAIERSRYDVVLDEAWAERFRADVATQAASLISTVESRALEIGFPTVVTLAPRDSVEVVGS